MSGLLSGEVALVTGAGSGIGRAVCGLLAREGARVVAADINEPAAQETVALLAGTDHMALLTDVTSEVSVTTAVCDAINKYGSPATCVVNCAGIFLDTPILDLTTDNFMRVIDVNLKGTFLVTKMTARSMVDAGVSGTIVNIASIAAQRTVGDLAPYCASKAGVVAFSRSAAMELGGKGIRVNVISPGLIATPMSAGASEKLRQDGLSQTVLGRAGNPEEVAELVLFLCSDRSSFMLGANVEITGGAGL